MRTYRTTKQSVYFSGAMLDEIASEAIRLDRSLSWMVQTAWRLSRENVRRLPGTPGEREREAAP